ncbi:MAG: hypothetical protein V1934_04375 [Methanobacteriota archaeon]
MEWLSSKVAMAVAVLVITGSVLGYYAYQRSSSYEGEVAEVARSMARWIESFSAANGEIRSNITFDGWGNLKLPESINGNPVSVNLSRNNVIVTCGKYVVLEEHTVPTIHLWEPQNRSMNTSAIALMDIVNPWTGNVSSPGKLVLERHSIIVSGAEQLFTFCYRAEDA